MVFLLRLPCCQPPETPQVQTIYQCLCQAWNPWTHWAYVTCDVIIYNKNFWEELICRVGYGPRQSFFPPSPVGLMTIFYCLKTLEVVQLTRLLYFYYDTDRIENTASVQELFYCCVWILCGGNVFT
jgi:hypothetical protein